MKTFILCCLVVLLCGPSVYGQWDKMWVNTEVFDINGEQTSEVERRLNKALDKMDIVVEKNSNLLLRGDISIDDEQEISGGFNGSEYLVVVRLDLSLTFIETQSKLASEVFTAKGMAKSRDKAITASYKKFKFSQKELKTFFDRARERLNEKLEAMNLAIYEEGRKLYDQGKLDQALVTLSAVPTSSASYKKTSVLIDKINKKQWAIWKAELEHEEIIVRQQTIQDSLRVDSLRAEVIIAEKLAKAAADSVEIERLHYQAMKDSLNSSRNEKEKQMYKERMMQAEEKVESLKAVCLSMTENSERAIVQRKEAKNKHDNTKGLLDGIMRVIEKGMGALTDQVKDHLVGNATGIPQNLVGRWVGNKYELILEADGGFKMTTPHKSRVIRGNCVIVNNKFMVLTADDYSLQDSERKLQLNYRIDPLNDLVLSNPAGFSVRLTRRN